MSDNPSVEELLKSLRQTVEKRAQEAVNNIQDEVIELGRPIKMGNINSGNNYGNGNNYDTAQKNQGVDSNITIFLNQLIEQAVLRVLFENQNLLKESLEKMMFNSGELKPLFIRACEDYFESRDDLDAIVKDVIEKKISKILRA